MSDETIEQILSARPSAAPHASTLEAFGAALRDAGTRPPAESAAAAHLSAMVAESRRLREGAIANAEQPAPLRALHAVSKRLAASAAASTAFIALAVAGVLPSPVQAAASDVLAVVGISIPDGGDERNEAGREQKQRPAQPSPESSRSAQPAAEPDHKQPRPATDTDTAAGNQADPHRDRSGAGLVGDGAKRDESSDENGGPQDSGEEPRRGSESDDARDESGADAESDEDLDESPGGGVVDDDEGPDAGSRPPDEPDDSDEPEESDPDTEERSGPSADALPDSDDELDEPEE